MKCFTIILAGELYIYRCPVPVAKVHVNVVVFPQLRRHGLRCAWSWLLQLLKLLMVLTCKLAGDKVNYFALQYRMRTEKFLVNYKPELSCADCSFVVLLSCHGQYSAPTGLPDGCLFLKHGQHDAEECKRQLWLMSMCESSWAVPGGWFSCFLLVANHLSLNRSTRKDDWIVFVILYLPRRK